MAISKPKFDLSSEYQQLSLGMDLPEVEEESVSVEEARLRSEAARTKFESSGASDEYRALRSEGWAWRQAAYIAWAASPKPRNPKTQEELARTVLGLASDRVINTWRIKNPMIVERIGMLQSATLFEHRAEIIAALVANATNPDYKGHNDRKLALEMLGDYVPTSKLSALVRKSGGAGDLSGMSEDELLALVSDPHAAPLSSVPVADVNEDKDDDVPGD